MPCNFSYSKGGLSLTESCEGLRLQAYQDSVGVWTIGYGHTHGVFPGMSITQLQAEQFLLDDAQAAVNCVNQLVAAEINQNHFDALVDFVFNEGPTHFATSTLLENLNANDFDGASGQFLVWDRAGGQVLQGLLTRRTKEQTLFNTPYTDDTDAAGTP